MKPALSAIVAVIAACALARMAAADSIETSWRYYRPGNTGIQGDYNEAIWIGPDGDPWIGGYVPTFEEGGIAKFVQAENRWINISNVDYPVIGHPDSTGCSRVSDIVADGAGRLWMGTGRGALRFDPAVGPSSLASYGPHNSSLPGGWTTDVDIAPDGTVWFTSYSTAWGGGGIARYRPSTGAWSYWATGNTHLSVQPKPGGGYYVWSGDGYYGYVFRFDSATQTWTTLPFTGAAGEVAGLPGKDCTDDAGNFWAQRITTPGGWESLDYRRPDGTWATPPEPYPGVTYDIWAFRAYGIAQALLATGNGEVWRFDGNAWASLGQWRPGGYTYDVNMDGAGAVWVCGTGGAARRDPATGAWQRFRITNTSQIDYWVRDLSLEEEGAVWLTGNAGTGYGGFERFDGARWYCWNDYTYGRGGPWGFPTDNADAVAYRPSNGRTALNPMFNGIREWTGTTFVTLDPSSTSKGLVEDSIGRLWSLGEYFSLRYHDGSGWTQVGMIGWGNRIQRDPDRAGTIWAATGHEVTRTDGAYRYSRGIEDFPELTTQSDTFSGLAAAPGGIAWIGATVQYGAGGAGGALIRLDSSTGSYQMLRYDQGWPLPGQYVSPLAVTPDGRVWMQYDSDYLVAQRGLCWYDGASVGVFPAPPFGEPQWGGLPHAQIVDAEVRPIPGGYELWLSCASRGIAVLTVRTAATSVAGGPEGSPETAGSGLSLEQNSPNPFNRSTRLAYAIPRSGRVTLEVFDIAGRRVRTLLAEERAAGSHELEWDGRDARGARVSGGVYFARLVAESGVVERRMVLIR